MDILRNKQDGNAISRGQSQLHMIAWKFIIQKHTNAAIEGIPPKKINTGNIWKQILSRVQASFSYKDKCNTKYNMIIYYIKQKDKEYGGKQKWKDSVSGTRTKR